MSSTALVASSSSSSQLQQTQADHHTAIAQQKPSTPVSNGAAVLRAESLTGQPSSQQKTPQQQLQQPSSTRSTPGQWVHPKMAEITRRRHRTTFDTSNARRVVTSAVGLVLTVIVPGAINRTLPRAITHELDVWLTWPSYVVQLILIANISLAVLPLLRAKDAMEDIPLTPQQRRLLDLPPMSRPSTPQEQAAWVTPPRYSRNTTPTSSDSLFVNARGTPLSEREVIKDGFLSSTPPQSGSFVGRRASGSPFGGSPLARASPDVSSSRRRDSSGTPRSSPLGGSDIDAFGMPAAKNKRVSVGLNSKWLYEKGTASPSGFMASGWGSGSVFT